MSTTNDENPPHTYETLQSQAPSTVPNSNPPVPAYLQNVSPPLPAYNVSPPLPAYNVSPPLPAYNVSPPLPAYNVSPPLPAYNVSPPLPTYNVSPSAQVWSVPSAAQQWSVAHVAAPNTDPSSPFYQTFLKSKPKALGIVLIISAILDIALGIGLAFISFSITLPSGIPFWGPIFYIIAGSLTIAACSKPNTCLVRGSLALNIISSIFSIIAVILIIIDLATLRCYYYSYPGYYGNDYYYKTCIKLRDARYAVLSLLLIINLLLFCVSFSLSIFGCRSLSKISSNSPQMFLIQNDVMVSMNPSTGQATFSGIAQPFTPANAAPQPYVFQEVKARPLS